MSHYRVKTKYNEEGAYGSVDEKVLYAHHNLSCDYVTFFDENGNVIMTVPDTMDNNILDAINRLYMPFKKDNILDEGIEFMNADDKAKIER